VEEAQFLQLQNTFDHTRYPVEHFFLPKIFNKIQGFAAELRQTFLHDDLKRIDYLNFDLT
jgi:hypothetical protein